MFLASMLVASLLAAAPAGAAKQPAAPSCVDPNNNGVCDPGEPLLAPLLDQGSFDTSEPQPGYTPNDHAGIVLNGFTGTEDGLFLFAGGNISVNGTLKVPGDIDLETETGKVIIGAGAAITTTKSFGLTVFARQLLIGDSAKMKISGSDSFSDIEVQDLKIGNRVQISTSGRDTELDIFATGEVVLGDGIQVKLPSNGFFVFNVNTNIAATGLKVKAGDIDIEALARENATSPPTRKIELTDSQLDQRAKDGSLFLAAGEDGFHSSRDEVKLTNTKITAKGDLIIDPPPTIIP
jgi:hypothetical protein